MKTDLPINFGPYLLKELAHLYRDEMDIRTFQHALARFRDQIGEMNGKYFWPAQVKVIFKKLGPPNCFLDEWLRLEKEGKI